MPGFATDNGLFILTIYKAVVLSPTAFPTQADFDYWNTRLVNTSEAARQQSRNLMLARLATESFNPTPVASMTAFDLTVSNRNKVIFGVLLAGLMRMQLTMPEFVGGYVFPADLGPIGAIVAIFMLSYEILGLTGFGIHSPSLMPDRWFWNLANTKR